MEALQVPQVDVLRVEEQQRIRQATEIERKWWPRESKFFTADDAEFALKNGNLIRVPRTDGNFRLIGRLGDEHGEPDLLRPGTVTLLERVAALWKEKAGDVAQDKQLAVTSLYRGSELQNSIKSGSGGYMAVNCEESSHSAGAAFDISLRSYYQGEEGNIRGVQSWNEGSGFDTGVLSSLVDVVQALKDENLCNFVVENNVTESASEPSVLHVCTTPEAFIE